MTLEEYKAIEPLWDEAVKFAQDEPTMGITKMQRKFRLGYNRAARLCERLEVEGFLKQLPNQYSWRRATSDAETEPK